MTAEEVAAGLAERVLPLIGAVPRTSRARLIAELERRAAERYRAWAAAEADREVAAGLRSCAEREEDIAARVEALFPDASGDRAWMELPLPEVTRLYGAALDGRSIDDQYRIQALAERNGADVWRALADAADGEGARTALLACARLEEENAAFLEGLFERR